jgi:hypothetical protein
MEKHKFDVTCPDALFVKAVVVPPEHEKECIDVSCPGCTEMPYVTHKSHRCKNTNFG